MHVFDWGIYNGFNVILLYKNNIIINNKQ